MKCPKCGYMRQNRDNVFAPPTECPACGVVYSKYLTQELSSTLPPLDAVGALKKPSPVHEDTLKQARERVERRLRKKINPDEKDEFREQTLKRAKLFVSEGVKKRREEMQQRKSETQKEAHTQIAETEAASHMDFETDEESQDLAQAVAQAEAELIHADEQAEDTLSDVDVPILDANESIQDFETDTDTAEANGPEAVESDIVAVAAEGIPEIEADMDKTGADTAIEAEAVDEEREEADDQAFTIGVQASDEHLEDGTHSLEPTPNEREIPEQSPTDLLSAAMLEAAASSARLDEAKRANGGLMRLLPAVAWMILVAGVIGAVLSWTSIGDVQAGIDHGNVADGNRLPLALLLGFAYLATGVLGFAFFWVSSMINAQIRDIRMLLIESILTKKSGE